jgi:hypothetical protein
MKRGRPFRLATRGDARQLERASEALAQSWSRDTSAEPEVWSEQTPSRGQCAVTALVVQDLFGGELLRCDAEHTSHYWNRLPSGHEVDLTRHQFGPDFKPEFVEKRSRAYVLSFPDTIARYSKLRRNVMAKLGEANGRSPAASD